MKRTRKTANPLAAQDSNNLTVRLDDDLRERLARACQTVKLDKSTLVRLCLDAIVDLIEHEQQITVPLHVALSGPRPRENAGESAE